jgi:hypothetical protein
MNIAAGGDLAGRGEREPAGEDRSSASSRSWLQSSVARSA